MAAPAIGGTAALNMLVNSDSDRKPCAIVPPNTVFCAATGSTWMNCGSLVTAAKASMATWETGCGGEGPIASPTRARNCSIVNGMWTLSMDGRKHDRLGSRGRDRELLHHAPLPVYQDTVRD